jgi:hypothetical protein
MSTLQSIVKLDTFSTDNILSKFITEIFYELELVENYRVFFYFFYLKSGALLKEIKNKLNLVPWWG